MSAIPIEGRISSFLLRHRKEGALWTSDIAIGLREPTPFIRKILKQMEKSGTVRRVVIGSPTSWELVP